MLIYVLEIDLFAALNYHNFSYINTYY